MPSLDVDASQPAAVVNTIAGKPLLSTHSVSIRFGSEHVLHAVSFSIAEREIVTVVGPNGSGKSTLLRLLIGALLPDSGKVVRHASDLRIGYIPQRLAFDANLPITVGRFLSLNVHQHGSFNTDWLKRMEVAHLHDRQLAQLSGGQLQRVLLAQAMGSNPHVLILDEATQGLDQPGEAAFYRLIESVRDELGCAVLLVSHDLHVVMSASDRVVCLNGHVCCEGTPTLVSAAPEYRALFGLGTEGTLALYRHEHDHQHDHDHHTDDHSHDDDGNGATDA